MKLEAKDVLTNISRPPRAKKCRFLSLATFPLTLTFKLVRARDQNVFCVNVAHIRSAVPEIFHTQTKKVTDGAKNKTLRSSPRAVNTHG